MANKIWTEQFKIRSYNLDAKGDGSLAAIGNYLLECAGNHATSEGFGFSDMIKENLVWVLTRFRISMLKYPEWGDSLTINTWAKSQDRIFYYRDFEFSDTKTGTSIGSATSSWALIDLVNRMPQRSERLENSYPQIPNKHAIEEKPSKIESLVAGIKRYTFKVQYSDLDVNMHVNSIKYLQWVLNAQSMDRNISYSVKDIEINYLGEAHFADDIEVYREEVSGVSDTFLTSIVRKTDGKELCRVRNVWLQRDLFGV